MAEADPSIQQTTTTAQARITTAARILARLRARQAVKASLRAQGLKLTNYSAREITSWAQVYLDDHCAELIPPALAQAHAMIASGALGKRAQRELAQSAMCKS
jgi:hypothetical protein